MTTYKHLPSGLLQACLQDPFTGKMMIHYHDSTKGLIPATLPSLQVGSQLTARHRPHPLGVHPFAEPEALGRRVQPVVHDLVCSCSEGRGKRSRRFVSSYPCSTTQAQPSPVGAGELYNCKPCLHFTWNAACPARSNTTACQPLSPSLRQLPHPCSWAG